jgi:hypothetical protein
VRDRVSTYEIASHRWDPKAASMYGKPNALPHRALGLPSLIDPILHPNDPYNRDVNPLTKVKKPPPPEPVTPLPDATSSEVRNRLEEERLATARRRGFRSTMISGQMGDARAPAVSQPLVLGRSG